MFCQYTCQHSNILTNLPFWHFLTKPYKLTFIPPFCQENIRNIKNAVILPLYASFLLDCSIPPALIRVVDTSRTSSFFSTYIISSENKNKKFRFIIFVVIRMPSLLVDLFFVLSVLAHLLIQSSHLLHCIILFPI